MTAHKHAKLIKAKADNMELVVFEKDPSGWLMRISDIIHMSPSKEYFLCLPQHKEACLHWLNGGEIQALVGNSWDDCGPHLGENQAWFIDGFLMNNGCDYRIKPRKEKLWLAVKTDKHEHLGGCIKVRICSHAFVNKQDAEDYLDLRDSQLIEIEVEV